jgi:hypothetical protein
MGTVDVAQPAGTKVCSLGRQSYTCRLPARASLGLTWDLSRVTKELPIMCMRCIQSHSNCWHVKLSLVAACPAELIVTSDNSLLPGLTAAPAFACL